MTLIGVGSATAACAACPQNVADCLGQAAAYSVVADKLTLNKGFFRLPFEDVTHEGASTGNACARRASAGGGIECTASADNLILTAADGVAGRFASYRCNGVAGNPGVYVSGDLVTGGGLLSGGAALEVGGTIDTSGSDPRVAICAQALSDMRSAASNLAALTPTRDLGTVRADPDGISTISLTADPGVNVWTASELRAPTKSRKYENRTSIVITLDAATDSVIINTRKVFVGTYSEIAVVGDASKVLLNVDGNVSNRGDIAPSILAPDGKFLERVYAGAGFVAAGNVTILGGFALGAY